MTNNITTTSSHGDLHIINRNVTTKTTSCSGCDADLSEEMRDLVSAELDKQHNTDYKHVII